MILLQNHFLLNRHSTNFLSVSTWDSRRNIQHAVLRAISQLPHLLWRQNADCTLVSKRRDMYICFLIRKTLVHRLSHLIPTVFAARKGRQSYDMVAKLYVHVSCFCALQLFSFTWISFETLARRLKPRQT